MAQKRAATRVAFETLGCKLNQAETEMLSRELTGAGYRLVGPEDSADIYILNTCTVTHIADRKARQKLRLAHRRHPAAKLVAIGCYAERAAGELEQIEGVDLVLGNIEKWQILRRLEESGGLPRAEHAVVPRAVGRTRAFIKVQDGCRHCCAYCIVPLVRNRPSCVSADEVVAEVQKRVAEGYQEVVITGTEVGDYRHDGIDLKGLLERILSGTSVKRLRLSSLQPPEISPELVGLWHDRRLCPHFHLSLQSGSEAVLRRMKRRYATLDYRQAVELIRNTVPDVSITTDVIVGFPGETGAEFEESSGLCEQMKFARIHVFPYSPRPGTAAANLPPVPAEIKKQRTGRMLALASESLRCFNQQFLGREMAVLWEQKTSGLWSGLTGNYIRVYSKGGGDLINRIMPVRLMKLYKDGATGEFLNPTPCRKGQADDKEE